MLLLLLNFLGESLLVVGYLGWSAYVLARSPGEDGALLHLVRLPDYTFWEAATAIGFSWAAYTFLRLLGFLRLTFWSVILLGLILLLPAILAHNLLDWTYFWADRPLFSSELSAREAGVALLVSGGLALALHRARRLQSRYLALTHRGAEPTERVESVRNEALVFGAALAASLVLTLATMAAGLALGSFDTLLGRSPWTVLSVGMTATFLVAGVLLLWLPDRRE